MITKAYTIVAELSSVTEAELDELVQDLYSFKKYARLNGTIKGMENRMLNVYDETDFNHIDKTFSGKVRVYMESDEPSRFIDDMVDIIRHHECDIVHYSVKWRV